MRFGTLIDMFRNILFVILLIIPIVVNSKLLMIDEVGDIAISSDSIEIKSRSGKKLVQGVVYGFNAGIKNSMAQFRLRILSKRLRLGW